MINKHGLKRDIPDPIKRAVRQRCGFGCVSCGKGIIQYDHFDPEYSDARDHSADGITLLCGSCHDEKKHGLLTNAQVAAMNASPYCLKQGAAFGQFRLTGAQPIVMLGNNEFRRCKIILEIAGERVLWFNRPEYRDDGLCLNARIRNEKGEIVFEIIDNEWRIGDDLWDVDTSGNGILIRSRTCVFSLILRFKPPETIKIERADIQHRGTRVRITKGGCIIEGEDNRISRGMAVGCYTGIRIQRPGYIELGCKRPKSLVLFIKLRQTSAIVPVKVLGTSKPLNLAQLIKAGDRLTTALSSQ